MPIRLAEYWGLLRAYLLPLWPRVLLLGAAIGGGIGVQIQSPFVLKQFIDSALAGAPAPALGVLALLFLGLAAANQLLSVLAAYASQDVGWRATNQLRADVTRHALELDLSFHKSRNPGEMIERIDGDVTALANFFSQFVLQVLSNAVLLVGVLVVLFGVNWRVGVALTGFAAANLCSLLYIRSAATPGWQAARQRSAEYFGFLGERLAGLEDIRANGAGGHTLLGLARHMRLRLQAELKAGRGVAVMLMVSFGLIALGMATALGVS